MRARATLLCLTTALASAAGASCGNFELPSLVLDLRILGMISEPPEVIVPLTPDSDLGDLPRVDVSVCALVSDPNADRRLSYRMTACWPTESLRCDDPARAAFPLAGTAAEPWVSIDDPEQASGPDGGPVEVCGLLRANSVLPALLLDQIEVAGSLEAVAAEAAGAGGNIDVQVELAVRGADEDEELAQYGSKRARFGLPLPPERVANQNPGMDDLMATVEDAAAVSAPVARCGDSSAPLEVRAGEVVEFEPVEAEGAREDYLVPTFDGGARMFTENLRYAWFATRGGWQREVSGGPRDFAGNEPPLSSEWTAPANPDVVGDGLEVRIWVVQRDERGGQSWRETCVRVLPQ
ncbi:hypothetical protein [Haliangium sp.]|uniref:hypothetical protein n=1 Tax=Haliangium sp. TaxID=2663208 RepID=UPI003D0BFA8E